MALETSRLLKNGSQASDVGIRVEDKVRPQKILGTVVLVTEIVEGRFRAFGIEPSLSNRYNTSTSRDECRQ